MIYHVFPQNEKKKKIQITHYVGVAERMSSITFEKLYNIISMK